jgi:5'-methylthioadenosine phosphorylase
MKNCRVERIIAVSTVGSMKQHIPSGCFVVPSDFVDFTKRKTTFFDDSVVHVDMSLPFCPQVSDALKAALRQAKEKFFPGVYVATEGPRLETKTEIAMFSAFGDVVGMTLVPEAILAREKGICYASLCLVSNMCAGMQQALPAGEIREIYETKQRVVNEVLNAAIMQMPSERGCSCSMAPEEGKL